MKKLKKSSISKATVLSLALLLASTMSVEAAGPAEINLGTAGSFVVLSKTGISSTGSTAVVGDIGVSPISATAITGFSLILPTASPYSTSAIVTGKVYAADYTAPTPSNLSVAVNDMETAYTDGAGRSNPTATELGAGNIGGLTIAPGLYKWGTSVIVPTDVTLSGGSNDVWIFQIAQTLNVSSGAKIVLAGGAQAKNVFFIVGGQTTIGTTAVFNGNILGKTAIVLNTGATLNGRALAQTAVTLDANAVNIPSGSVTTTTTSTQTSTTAPVTNTNTSTNTSTSVSSSNSTNSTNSSPSNSVTNSSSAVQVNTVTRPTMTTSTYTNTTSAYTSYFSNQVRTIATSLGEGSSGNSVTTLQQFLMSQDNGPKTDALVRVGATGYFGPITRAALAEFQARVGISPALGNFGPITRAYLNSRY